MQHTKSILRAGLAFGALLAVSGSALAGAFAIREQSAEDLGDAFAGAATSGTRLSSMFWNPATMTSHQGMQSSMSFSGIFPYANITGTSSSSFSANKVSGNIGLAALVPSSSFSYQVNDSLWAGLSVNSPFGLETKSAASWTGGIYGTSSAVRTINIRPTLAYKFNDMVSVGLGVDIQRFSLQLTNQDPAVPTTEDLLKGNSWGVGFTAGLTIKPAQGTEIGIGYRSQIHQNVHGTIAASALAGVFHNPLLAVGAPVRANVTLPDQFNVGLRQKVTDQLTMMAGFEWTHWSVFNKFPVTLASSGTPVTALAFGYRNGWMASLGGEYKFSPNMTARLGIAYESSPITDATRGVRLPDSNRIWTTAGLNYAVSNKLSFDIGYAHIFPSKGTVSIVPGNPAYNPGVPVPFLGSVQSHIDIVSVGLNYRWDDPKELPVQKPIVRKY